MTGFYDRAKRLLLGGGIDLSAGEWRLTLVDVDLHPIRLSEDWVIADVPARARLATKTLTGRQLRQGVLYADNVTFEAVGRLDDERLAGMVLWIDTGDEESSSLICAWGRAGEWTVSRWPLRLNGGDVVIMWGEDGILRM